MPRRYSTAELITALERVGFSFVRQRGSHIRYRGIWRGQERNVTLVAGQKQVPPGVLRSILRQSGFTVSELTKLIEGGEVEQGN